MKSNFSRNFYWYSFRTLSFSLSSQRLLKKETQTSVKIVDSLICSTLHDHSLIYSLFFVRFFVLTLIRKEVTVLYTKLSLLCFPQSTPSRSQRPILSPQSKDSKSLSGFYSSPPNLKWVVSQMTQSPPATPLRSSSWWFWVPVLWSTYSSLCFSHQVESTIFNLSRYCLKKMLLQGKRMELVVEGLRTWSFGVMLWSGVRTSSSIPLRSVARLVRLCVVAMMGRVCVIPGSFVEIGRLADRNSERWV